MATTQLEDILRSNIKRLNELIWKCIDDEFIERWLDNFQQDGNQQPSERLHALYFLSQVMYFGYDEIRELLRALYRDLYKYPIVEQIRRENNDTTDLELINSLFRKELEKTRFLGLGNPSESGYFLLYLFRQENDLPKNLFVNTHEIFKREVKPVEHKRDRLSEKVTVTVEASLRYPEVTRYVFVDDLCGSGSQAKRYSKGPIGQIKAINPDIETYYFTLFATESGLEEVESKSGFDHVKSVCLLDKTYKCFSDESRYFPERVCSEGIDKEFAEHICRHYGSRLVPDNPLGFGDSQLLMAFAYNTPNNTLPVFWHDGTDEFPWQPIFRRHSKIYRMQK